VIEEIRQLNIVDIVSPHTELKKAGGKYWALCPLPNHLEKTPSFCVDERKGFFYCFGCHEGGNGISFIQKCKGYDFTEALIYLCEQFGIDIKYDDRFEGHNSSLKELHGEVADYCAGMLYSKVGETALEYLRKRGFADSLIKQFKLGYMPKFPEVPPFEKKYGAKLLEQSGIFTERGSMFRERLMFPIHSFTGACVAFSGRTLDNTDKRKYINSPDTPIFNKRNILYNFYSAMSAVKKSKACYLVEGYFDVIRMVGAGFENTVAVMGTAVSQEGLSQLAKHGAEEYNLLLDGDSAGTQAMQKSYKVALAADIYPNIILLPQNEDPDSFIAKNGAGALAGLGKKDLIEYMIRWEFDNAEDINAKFHRLDDVRKMLEQIKNPYRREHYIKLTSDIFEVNVRTLTADVGAALPRTEEFDGKRSGIKNPNERRFLSLLLQLPEESADKVTQDIPANCFEDKTAAGLYTKILEHLGDDDLFARLLEDKDLAEAAALLLMENEDSAGDIFTELYDCKNRLLIIYYENYGKTLTKQAALEQSEPGVLLREFGNNYEKIKELRLKLKRR
jgi:DNA primase